MVKAMVYGKKWIKPNQLLNPNLFEEQMEKLHQTNTTLKLDAIWLIGATQTSTFKKFGLRYNIHSKSYKRTIQFLQQQQVKIGLHSVALEPVSKQCNTLSQLIHQPISYHRSHYLKFTPENLFPALQRNHITIDFSLGHARKVFIPEQPMITHGISCVPTVLFDNSFFFDSPQNIYHQFTQVCEQAATHNTPIALLFHPENFAVNPQLWDHYHRVVDIGRSFSLC